MSGYFFESWVPGLVLWVLLYVSDYVCTIASARLYRAGANQHIVFEGSFEITPYYQKDIDALRRVSPRFLLALSGSIGVILYLWFSSRWLPDLAPLYPLCLGALILMECTVHMRHLRNLYFFRSLVAGTGLSGRIEYTRPFMLRLSAAEVLSFAGMYLVLSVVLMSWFFLGGALGCLSLGMQHLRLARTAGRSAPNPRDTPVISRGENVD